MFSVVWPDSSGCCYHSTVIYSARMIFLNLQAIKGQESYETLAYATFLNVLVLDLYMTLNQSALTIKAFLPIPFSLKILTQLNICQALFPLTSIIFLESLSIQHIERFLVIKMAQSSKEIIMQVFCICVCSLHI